LECGDAGLRKTLFAALRNRLGVRPLEAHQLLPIDLELLGLNSLAFHAATPIDHFRRAYEHFLRSIYFR
jgi:hypothetical protein